MKKVAVFVVMFFLFLSQAFTDEKLNENMYFSWQFSAYKLEKQNMGFTHLNPMFFHNAHYFSMDSLDSAKNVNPENKQLNYTDSQKGGNSPGFGLLLFFSSFLAPDLNYLNKQSPGRFDYMLERQKEEKLQGTSVFSGFY
jgi:hypothetical protein